MFSASAAEVEETASLLVLVESGDDSALDAGRSPFGLDELFSDGAFVVEGDAVSAPLNPEALGSGSHTGGQIFVYAIRPGDTLSAIAKSFGVSVNTILWANDISDTRSLKVGDQLVILPVSGVRHEVRRGDSVDAIAKRYRARALDIIQFNGLAEDGELAVGSVVIVPNGELAPTSAVASALRAFANLPSIEGYYLRPISGGRKSRGIHGYNGVDLAASCGLPVFASTGGEVLVARASGWNGGYGRYVVIAHPNGTQTLYAHLRDLVVIPSQSVPQGLIIGSIGSSGNSTGCHVHFEVRGARNPF